MCGDTREIDAAATAGARSASAVGNRGPEGGGLAAPRPRTQERVTSSARRPCRLPLRRPASPAWASSFPSRASSDPLPSSVLRNETPPCGGAMVAHGRSLRSAQRTLQQRRTAPKPAMQFSRTARAAGRHPRTGNLIHHALLVSGEAIAAQGPAPCRPAHCSRQTTWPWRTSCAGWSPQHRSSVVVRTRDRCA